jgi:uncharacterized membrane protein
MPKFDRDEFQRIAAQIPVARDPASVRKRVEAMEALLERAFTVPGTNYRVGLDAVVGLVPVVGDLVTTAMGAWIVWEARNLGMSRFQVARMAANVGVDTLIGAIPLVGDLFDLAFRSNSKNLRILKRWLDRNHPETLTIEGEIVERGEPRP